MNDEIENLIKKNLLPFADELKKQFIELGEDGLEEKCKAIINAIVLLLTITADDADETILFVINIIGNLANGVLDISEDCFPPKGVAYIHSKVKEMLPVAFKVCVESVGIDWQKDLNDKLKSICPCPEHEAMRNESIH